MVLFHGTTMNIGIVDMILPAIETNNLREDFRKNNLDVVYLTDSIHQAKKYAYKACEKFGGIPIVYSCSCDNWVAERRPHEFVTPSARVEHIVW